MSGKGYVVVGVWWLGCGGWGVVVGVMGLGVETVSNISVTFR
jgi:hypothetical protein